jgi:hypothetical protein
LYISLTPIYTVVKELRSELICHLPVEVNYILNPEDVDIGRLFLLVFTYSWWHASANYHVYKHYKGFVYLNYTYKLLFIALFDDLNLIISICLSDTFNVQYLYHGITKFKFKFTFVIGLEIQWLDCHLSRNVTMLSWCTKSGSLRFSQFSGCWLMELICHLPVEVNYILNPEDVDIGQLFLLVFTYILL